MHKILFSIILLSYIFSQNCEEGSVWLFRHCNNFYDGHSDGCLLPSGCFSIEQTTFIDLYNEWDLEGLEIPPEIGDLINLVTLDLSHTDIIGTLPAEIGNLVNLEELIIYHTYSNDGQNFGGDIPSEIGNLINLRKLYLGGNSFTNLPESIGNLANLEELNLYDNQIQSAIPVEIGNLINLKKIYLGRNFIYGPIPDEIGNLIDLEYLSLKWNDISGSIPSSIENLINLKLLDVNGNLLSGSIPEGIVNLVNLELLYLYSNELTGEIPSGIGNLTNLNNLYLYNNNLEGTIPSSISNLANIDNIDLHHNDLTGSIPVEIGNITSPEFDYLDLSGNQLSGQIPESLCNYVDVEIDIKDNQLCPNYPSCFNPYSIGEQETADCCDGNGLEGNNCDCSGNIWDCANVCGGENVPSGCDNQCGSNLEFDCNNECGGDAEVDECGVCGGSGIEYGKCDCNGNTLDECGVCDGNNSCFGCTYSNACNYDESATIDDGNCEFAIEYYDCDGDCIAPIDCNNECSGNALLDECGVCDGNNSCFGCTYSNACNYDASATIDDGSCEYPSQNYDCSSNCIAEVDCAGICGGNTAQEECDYCSLGFDCFGECGGNALLDECGVCGGDGPANGFSCNGESLSISSQQVPSSYNVNSIYPNPFNPITRIEYGIPRHSKVQILVYDLSGKPIATLVDDYQSPAYYTVAWNADSYPSGMYFVKMIAEEHINTQKLMLIK